MGRRTRTPDRTKIAYKDLALRVARSEAAKGRRLTRADVFAILDEFLDQAIDALVEFEEIHIRGFGQLYRFETLKRIIKHPQTKEELVIPPRFDVNFKMGSRLKRKLGFEDTPKRTPKRTPKKPVSKEEDIPTDM